MSDHHTANLRRCWYKSEVLELGEEYTERMWKPGLFHAWTLDAVQYFGKPVQAAMAIIEDSLSHKVKVVGPAFINFSEEKPVD